MPSLYPIAAETSMIRRTCVEIEDADIPAQRSKLPAEMNTLRMVLQLVKLIAAVMFLSLIVL